MAQSKELRRARAAWESWIEPVSMALDDIESLAYAVENSNMVGIKPKELAKLYRQFENVMRHAWEISYILDDFDRRIEFAQEDAAAARDKAD